MMPLTVFDFRIDAWKPDTLPMARLAEYLARLTVVFGHHDQVSLLKVRKGSAFPEFTSRRLPRQKVQARLQLVSVGDGPDDASKSLIFRAVKLRWQKKPSFMRQVN